jgi:S1-C subfamily serine protease
VLEGSVRARGRDIYDRSLVTREIWVVGGEARPGNSGGPLVDEQGRYLGVVFAGSVSHPGQSYALAPSEVAPAIEAAAAATEALDMRAYACVS